MKQKVYVLAVCSIIIATACDRINSKGRELAVRAENKVKSKSKDVADKIFPIFDAHKADTKYNRKRFKEYLVVDVTNDVNTIYAFGDFLGADYKILIAFKCNSSTIQKIVEQKNLNLPESENDTGLLFPDEFPWWDKNAIETIQPYKRIEKSGDRIYLWYDKTTKTGYYEQFSI